MTFKDILVHIDNSEQSAAVLDLAIELARRHEAHLTGLHVVSHPPYSPQRGCADSGSEAAQAYFREKTEQAGISAEWLCEDWPVVGVSVSEVVTLHAYAKDLVIVGQPQLGSRRGETETDLPERVIVGSGRPVLIVPYAGKFSTVGERVMVAWKAGRESSRAVNDALPFLLKAGEVKVMAVSPQDAGEGEGGGPCSDIRLHLARHGIEAAVDRFSVDEVSIGDVLLNQAWEEGCDLLVMGAYTRTPRGLVVGPIARHVLRHMTSPVLMSH
jgi:nucleotide-binding universal stress UspA family protein